MLFSWKRFGPIKRSPLDHVKLLKVIVKHSNNKKIGFLDQDGTFVRPRKNQDFFLEKVNFFQNFFELKKHWRNLKNLIKSGEIRRSIYYLYISLN